MSSDRVTNSQVTQVIRSTANGCIRAIGRGAILLASGSSTAAHEKSDGEEVIALSTSGAWGSL